MLISLLFFLWKGHFRLVLYTSSTVFTWEYRCFVRHAVVLMRVRGGLANTSVIGKDASFPLRPVV